MVLGLGCKGPVIFEPNHHTYISFGSLDGPAGSYLEYRILPDGSAFKKADFNQEFLPQKHIEVKKVKQIFAISAQFEQSGIALNDPGKITHFIRVVMNGKSDYELIWGGSNESVDNKVTRLYQNVKILCSDDNPVR